MRAIEFLTELWTQPYQLESRAIGAADREYNFTTIDDRKGRIVFDSMLDSDQGGTHLLFVVVHFYIDNEFHDTGKGDAIKIFSTVVTACKDYLTKFKPPIIVFESESRKKRNLYLKIAQEAGNYEVWQDWFKNREIGQEIDNASVNGIREEMIVLRLKNYDPAKTRAYVEGVAEGKVKLYTDPSYFGAEVDDTGFDSLPVVNIPTNRLVGFEPDSKMQEPKAKANVKKILAGLEQGDNIPPILVRKYKTGYQVLDGHHRFWAYKVAKKDTIPARVVDPKDIEEVGKQGVAEEQVNELYEPENSFPLNWYPSFDPSEAVARAYDRNRGYIDIKFTPIGISKGMDAVEVEFSRNDSYDMTGGGDANRVLGTVLEAFREYLKGYQPKIFVFSAKGGSRSKVYQSLIKRFAANAGYKQFDINKLSPESREKISASGSDLLVLRKMY